MGGHRSKITPDSPVNARMWMLGCCQGLGNMWATGLSARRNKVKAWCGVMCCGTYETGSTGFWHARD